MMKCLSGLWKYLYLIRINKYVKAFDMKWFTPFIYVALLFPMTAIAVGAETIARKIGVLGEYHGVIDFPGFIFFSCIILLTGIPIYWIASMLLLRIEKLTNPGLKDHLRQSAFFYIILISNFTIWTYQGFNNNEERAYLLMWMAISFVGIITNYIYLNRLQHK